MAEPTICAVIPVLNGANYLDQSLASVAMQRRLPDEVVVVDDGSSDGSADIAERWAGLLPIRVIRFATNQGCWAARNAAIESTESELIALLDADDIWLPDHLAVLLAAYEARPGLITANAIKWVEQEAIGIRAWDARRPLPEVSEQLERLLIDNYVYVGSLFSRELCLRVGGFREFSVGCEDWDLWLRMVAAGATVVRPLLPTMLYRLRDGSLSSNDALLDSKVDVLESFKREHSDPRWQRAADAAIRRHRAEQHLHASYTAAASGHTLQARLQAIRSFRRADLDGRVAAVAMTIAPTYALARRTKLRRDAARAVHR